MNYEPAIELLRQALPGTEAIYLFGSRARRDGQPTSDVDLAVPGPVRLDAKARYDLQERIAACLSEERRGILDDIRQRGSVHG